MGDVLDEASALVQCRECPWYRSCVMPMRFTPEDLRRQFAQSDLSAADSGMAGYLAEMAQATQNIVLEGCPVFVERLRQSPRLAEEIKKMMRSWGTSPDESGSA
ncbi:hypothetical protein ACFLX5_02025 [Chloroflexota bacterium]